MGQEVKEVPEKISEPKYHVVDTVTDREITLDQTLPAGKSEEQRQVPSTASLSKEEDHETTTTLENRQEESTKENESEIHSIKLQETSAIVAQFSTIEPQNAGDIGVTVEEERGEAEVTKTPETIFVSKSFDFEDEIHKTRESLTVDKNDSEKMEEEIKEVPGTIAEPEYHGVETVTDGDINPKSEEQLQVPNTALISKEQDHATTTTIEKIEDESTTKDETEGDITTLQETSTMVSQLSKIEPENAEDTSVTVEREADKIEVEETETSDEVLASKDRDVQEIHETGVEKTDATKMGDEVKEVPEKISEPEYHVVDTVTDREITLDQTLPAGKSEDHETTTTLENPQEESTKENESEVNSMKLQETSAIVAQLSTIEPQSVEEEGGEAEETKTPETIFVSKSLDFEDEIHETRESLTVDKNDSEKMEEDIKEVPGTIAEPEYHGVETVTDGEINRKSEVQLQVPNIALLSKEEDHATATTIEKIEDESTMKDETEVDIMKLQETSTTVSQLSKIEPENAEDTSVTVEREADKIEVEETETSDEVLASKDMDVQEIHETDARKMGQEVKEVPEKISEPEYHVVDTVTDSEITPDQTLPAGKSEEQLQVPSTASLSKEEEHETTTTLENTQEESTKENESEVHSMKLQETSAIVAQLSTIEPQNAEDMSATAQKEVDNVEIEETKTSDEVFVSKDRDVEEVHEMGTRLTVEKTDAKKMEEVKEVPETLSEPECHGVETVTGSESTPDQTLLACKSEEQLQVASTALLSKKEDHETSTTTEKKEDESTKENKTEVDSTKLQETSALVSQLSTTEPENANNWSVAVEKDADVEETKISDVVFVSKDRDVEEIIESRRRLTVEKADASKIEEEIDVVPETISKPEYHGVETVIEGETTPDHTLQAGKSEEQLQTPSTAFLSKEQDREITSTLEKIEDESTKKDEIAVDSMNPKQNSSIVSKLSTIGPEDSDDMNVTVEKEADEVEVEENKTSEAVFTAFVSKDREVEELHETMTSLSGEKTDANKTEEEIKAVLETISEPEYHGVETVTDGEITPDQTLQARKSEEKLQVQSSAFLSKKEDHEMTTTIENIEDETTKKEETQVESMELGEDSSMVSQLPTTEAEKADVSVTVEKGADEVVELETSHTVLVSEDRGIKEIFEIGTSPTMEKTDIDKIEKEIKEVPETIYEGVETVTEVKVNPDQTLPALELEEQLQVPSSVFLITKRDHETTTTVEKVEDENTKKDETEFDSMKLEEISGVVSQLSKIEGENVSNVSVPVENLNADEVEVEGTKTSHTACESKDQVVEGIHETEEETKAVPETISEPKYQGVEAVSDGETAPDQTPPAKTSEDQLEEPSSALLLRENYNESTTITEKIEDESTKKDETQVNENLDDQLATCTAEERCVQTEEPREPEVSELKLKILEDIKDISTETPKEESTVLGGVSAREHQDNASEIKHVDSTSEYEERTVKEILTGEEGEKSEEASNVEFGNTTMVLESASDVHGPEVFIRQEETKSEEVKLEAATTELRAKETQTEETSEVHEAVENENSSEKIKEEKGVPNDSHLVSPDEETVAKSDQEDELRQKDETIDITKNGIQNEELSEELEKAGTITNATEIITVEERTAKDNDQVSTGNLTADGYVLLEAEDGKNVEKATEVDLDTNYRETLEEAVALREEVNDSESVMVKHDEDRTCANEKETEEVKRTNLDVLPVTSAEAEESPDSKIGEKIEEISELVTEEPIHEINKTHEENKDNTTTETNISESLKDNEKPTHTSLGLASKGCEVTEGLNLKEQEVYANEPSTLLQTETADKESVETVDEKQNDFAFEKQTTDEISIPAGEKSIKCEEELPKDEEPIEHSIMEKERNINETEIHSLIAAKEERETQVEDEELNVLAYGKDSSLAISQKDSILDVAKVSEIKKDVQEVEKITFAKSDEQIPREADPSESIEPEEKRVECGKKERTDDESEATIEESKSIELAKIPLSDLLQGFPKETPQVAEHLTEESELVVNKEEPQTETAERAQVEEAKTDEEEDNEHKTGDSGSDAPVMVEASRDMDVKPAHKKSHNILSGVGSKVKHSLAKVKKVITGKSAHPKPPSPKVSSN